MIPVGALGLCKNPKQEDVNQKNIQNYHCSMEPQDVLTQKTEHLRWFQNDNVTTRQYIKDSRIYRIFKFGDHFKQKVEYGFHLNLTTTTETESKRLPIPPKPLSERLTLEQRTTFIISHQHLACHHRLLDIYSQPFARPEQCCHHLHLQ